nr:MAG TPA: hypothetical protein [Bacteriophage sp.]
MGFLLYLGFLFLNTYYNMQKIRIGNDIRLNLTLRGPRTYDRANIKQLKCYFVNTSMLDCFQADC